MLCDKKLLLLIAYFKTYLVSAVINAPKQIFCMHLADTRIAKLFVIGKINIKAPVNIIVPDKNAIFLPLVVQNLRKIKPVNKNFVFYKSCLS